MKPKPLAALKNFTVPFCIYVSLFLFRLPEVGGLYPGAGAPGRRTVHPSSHQWGDRVSLTKITPKSQSDMGSLNRDNATAQESIWLQVTLGAWRTDARRSWKSGWSGRARAAKRAPVSVETVRDNRRLTSFVRWGRAVALGALLVAALGSRAHATVACPVGAGGGAALAAINPELRLRFIDEHLARTAHRAQVWTWGWGIGIGVATVANVVPLFFVAPEDRIDWYVGAGTTIVGIVPLLIAPLAVVGDARELRARLDARTVDRRRLRAARGRRGPAGARRPEPVGRPALVAARRERPPQHRRRTVPRDRLPPLGGRGVRTSSSGRRSARRSS